MPAALGLITAALPLFPSFIALTGVAFPGVDLFGRPVIFAVLGMCCLLAIYAVAMLTRYPQRGAQPLLLPLATVVAVGFVAGMLGFDPAAGLLFTGIGALGVIWHCSVMRFYRDRGVATTLLSAYIISGGVAAVVAIVMVVTRRPVELYAIAHGRATGTFILPGELAGYLVVLIPVAYAVGAIARVAWLRALSFAVLAVSVFALAMTFSRAGWMGCAAAVALLVARTRKPAIAAGVIAAGAATIALLFNAHHDPSEDYTRLSIWPAAIAIIDRFPLFGVGPFDFSRLYAIVRAPDGDATAFHAHSLYLTFFAELGLAGAAALAWTIVRFVGELRRRLQVASSPAAFLACAVAAGLAGVAVQGLIDTVSVVIFGLWMPTMGLALAAAGGTPDRALE
jgi:O-antigen ligase